MGGWIFDIAVGWFLGSVVFGLTFDVVSSLAGASDRTQSTLQLLGVLIGTVVGIGWMRHRREVEEESRPLGGRPVVDLGAVTVEDPDRPVRCAACGAEYLAGTILCAECMGTDLRPIDRA